VFPFPLASQFSNNLFRVAPESPSPSPGQPSPITVAVVEDDPSIRRVLAAWIQETTGFACVGLFPDAESAIAKMVECRPNVALVDINLPGLSGIECVRSLKPRLPETQFVMVTVYDDSTHIFDALAAGATGYLLKRTSREALIDALREVHAGGSPMSSYIARKVVQSWQQPKPAIEVVHELSKREKEVLALLAQGYLYKEIADAMSVSVPTVNSFIRRIYEKLHVNSRGQAVARYVGLSSDKG
jgi:DNA-binding NarL/FixJ family response regulator